MLHTHCRTIQTPSHHTPSDNVRTRSRSPERRPPYVILVLPVLLLCWLALPGGAAAQGLELSGGWAYISGSNGNGFNVEAGWYFTHHVQIAADYDTTWKDNIIGTFQLTSLGLVTQKNHLQNWLFGPRIFFYNGQIHKRKINVFGETQYGFSHTSTKLELVNMPSTSTTDNGFSWTLGGGADYRISRHWTARGKVDLLRNHFANTGQSRLRLSLGVAYTFEARER
jgi:hypothetical protein